MSPPQRASLSASSHHPILFLISFILLTCRCLLFFLSSPWLEGDLHEGRDLVLPTTDLPGLSTVPSSEWGVPEHLWWEGGHMGTDGRKKVYQPTGVAVAERRRLGGFNSRAFLSHSSGGQSPRSRCRQGRALLRSVRKDLSQPLSLACW